MLHALLISAALNAPTSTVSDKPQAGAVIVRVVGRDQTLTATATGNGVVYGVQTRDGRTLIAPATLDTLRATAPEAARQVETFRASAYAGVE